MWLQCAEREGGSGTSYGFYLNKPWRRRRACGFNMRDGMAGAPAPVHP